MALSEQSLVVSRQYLVKITKEKNVGINECDCHDMFSTCLAMTKRKRSTHHEELTMPFYGIRYMYLILTQDKWRKTRKYLSLHELPSFYYCEELPFFVIARSEATKQSHPIMLEYFKTRVCH